MPQLNSVNTYGYRPAITKNLPNPKQLQTAHSINTIDHLIAFDHSCQVCACAT